MDIIIEGIKQAFILLFTLDPEVIGITWLSLKVSGIATLISLLIGVSVGTIIALISQNAPALDLEMKGSGITAACVSHDTDQRSGRHLGPVIGDDPCQVAV